MIEDLIAVPANGLQSRNLTVSHAPNMTNWLEPGFSSGGNAADLVEGGVVSWSGSNPVGIVVQGTLHRDPQASSSTDPVIVDPPPPENQQPPPPPRWFQQMGGKV